MNCRKPNRHRSRFISVHMCIVSKMDTEEKDCTYNIYVRVCRVSVDAKAIETAAPRNNSNNQ